MAGSMMCLVDKMLCLKGLIRCLIALKLCLTHQKLHIIALLRRIVAKKHYFKPLFYGIGGIFIRF